MGLLGLPGCRLVFDRVKMPQADTSVSQGDEWSGDLITSLDSLDAAVGSTGIGRSA